MTIQTAMSHVPESAFTKWLRRRKYINLSLIYLGTVLVIVHFGEMVIHGLRMPDITFSLLVVLALAGLPIVLLISWAFDLNKPAVKRGRKTKGTGTVAPVSTRKISSVNWIRRMLGAVVSLTIFAAAIFIYNRFIFHSKFTGREKSLAVLPFVNLSDDRENAYFSDGMTEEMTTQLSKITELKVIAHTSSMLYKDSKKTIRQIAEELGVSAILGGSVQKSGNKIRITAQLVDANTQEQIWADTYDREFKEVFAIQSELAEEIAKQLNARLTKGEKIRIETAPTNNSKAYEYFLQGNQLGYKFFETLKPEYYANSKVMFEKAISLDSNYALAHAGLANLHNTYSNYVKRDSFLLILQQKEIEKAWSINPNLDYVNLTRGYVQQGFDKWEEAFNSFRRSVELAPNNSDNLFGLSQMLLFFGLADECKVLVDKAIQVDPLTAYNFALRGEAEFNLYNLVNAEKDCQIALQLEPDMIPAMATLGYIYSWENKLEEAKKLLDKSENLNQSVPGLDSFFAYSYAKQGNKQKALELSPDWNTFLALGMKEQALLALLKNDQTANPLANDYLFFRNYLQHNDFDDIRNDSRFLQLIEKKRIRYEVNKGRFSVADLIN